MRFYDTTIGNILVNNDDLCEFSLESLRENIGFVSQRIYIFNDTIANNVAYGKEYNEEKARLQKEYNEDKARQKKEFEDAKADNSKNRK